MKISGFTFIRNAELFYIPIKECIESILPIVDEFVIAYCESDDKTLDIIKSIKSDKIKILHSEWKINEFPKHSEYARQTDFAKNHCSGDWLFYLQGDEAIHEKDLDYIKKQCALYLNDKQVEGFTFKYNYFWGDYNHVHRSHAWYSREIRIIRNDTNIHSWKDAQSFRRYQNFECSFESYYDKKTTRKLNVIELDAFIYHYGFVRPPEVLKDKSNAAKTTYKLGLKNSHTHLLDDDYDYGNFNSVAVFKDSHPKVMDAFIAKFHWQNKLNFDPKYKTRNKPYKHEKWGCRVHSFIENTFLNGSPLWGFKNYKLIKKAEKNESHH